MPENSQNIGKTVQNIRNAFRAAFEADICVTVARKAGSDDLLSKFYNFLPFRYVLEQKIVLLAQTRQPQRALEF